MLSTETKDIDNITAELDRIPCGFKCVSEAFKFPRRLLELFVIWVPWSKRHAEVAVIGICPGFLFILAKGQEVFCVDISVFLNEECVFPFVVILLVKEDGVLFLCIQIK